MVGWSRGPAIATIGRAGCIIINQNGTMEKFTGTGGTSGQVIHHQKPCARAERCVQGCAFGAYIVTDFLVRARVSRLNSMQAVLVILYQVRPNIKKSISPVSVAISPPSQQYSTIIYSFNSTFGDSPQPSFASPTTSTLKYNNPCLASPRPPPASLVAENRK